MTVLEFAKKTPHAEGPCNCIECGHKWQGVAELSVLWEDEGWMECPNCRSHKGRFDWSHVLPAGTMYFLCACQNDLFNVTKEGVYCPNCGRRHTF